MYRILLILLCYCQVAVGQDHHIAAVADVKPGLIRLRWAPSSLVGWSLGIRYGYNIARYTLGENKVTLLTPQPIQPIPLAEMDANNEQVAIVAEVIYGENPVAEQGFGSFYEAKNKNEWRMAMALLSCDLSIAAAKSAGLYFEDRNIQEGQRYVYRISLARQAKNMLIDTAVVIAVPKLLHKPRELSIICADKTATLAWRKDSYSAYIVERSANGKDFHPISDLPVVSAQFKDTLPENEHRYFYRINGITPFGEYGPYSETISAIGLEALTERPELDTIIVKDHQSIEIRWFLPGDLRHQLSKIIITRANNSKGPFLPIATFNKILYAYTDQHPAAANYYRIKGVTKQGQEILSFPYFAQLADTIAPATPTALKGSVDTAGIATLDWKANTEPDLLGYRVFRANSLREEFVEVTKTVINSPAFSDTITLHTLSPGIYYKIIAVDKNYNTSPYSSPVLLKRPDTIPPSAALFTNVNRTDTAIRLNWHNSSSEDAVQFTLYRINTKDSIRLLVASWDTNRIISAFIDTTVRQGNTYYYELITRDDAGNKAIETSSDVYFESGSRPSVSNFKAEKQNGRIVLQWVYPLPDVKHYRIYRAKNNDMFTLFTSQPGTANEFTDNLLFPGNVYKYKISAVLQGDVKSAMSRVIEVIY
jgi:fibronectin type 3 domain-containing protein